MVYSFSLGTSGCHIRHSILTPFVELGINDAFAVPAACYPEARRRACQKATAKMAMTTNPVIPTKGISHPRRLVPPGI